MLASEGMMLGESAGDASLEPACAADLDALVRLLSNDDLPVADIESHLDAFTLAKRGDTLVGVAGLEIYGDVALLRSVCVAEAHRCRRIGGALVSAAASRALARGVSELYLLTTGAASYFKARGFAPISREQAPLVIRNTAQFSVLCPTSAVCMRRSLALSLPVANPSQTRSSGE